MALIRDLGEALIGDITPFDSINRDEWSFTTWNLPLMIL